HVLVRLEHRVPRDIRDEQVAIVENAHEPGLPSLGRGVASPVRAAAGHDTERSLVDERLDRLRENILHFGRDALDRKAEYSGKAIVDIWVDNWITRFHFPSSLPTRRCPPHRRPLTYASQPFWERTSRLPSGSRTATSLSRFCGMGRLRPMALKRSA